MEKFIGIKRLWYCDPVNYDLTAGTDVKVLIEGGTHGTGEGAVTRTAATEILNVHQDTWSYQQDDPTVEDYINQLTGKPYFRDKQDEGNKTISFTMGEYDYATKAALQGGSVISSGTPAVAIGWKAPETMAIIEKCIIALTKSGNYIIFTNASIIGKGDQQQKAIGLGVTAVAQDATGDGVADEYFFSGSAVVLTPAA